MISYTGFKSIIKQDDEEKLQEFNEEQSKTNQQKK
jgi:hypothetical protein